MSNALDEFKGVADAGITPDDNPGLETFVEGAGEMPAPRPVWNRQSLLKRAIIC